MCWSFRRAACGRISWRCPDRLRNSDEAPKERSAPSGSNESAEKRRLGNGYEPCCLHTPGGSDDTGRRNPGLVRHADGVGRCRGVEVAMDANVLLQNAAATLAAVAWKIAGAIVLW